MPLELLSEDELRAALRPFQVDPATFESGIRERIKVAESQPKPEPLASLSPWLRSAAAFLPLEMLAGCQGAAVAAKLAPASGASKLLSYLAFPAISLFVLVGATIFSIFKIRSIQDQADSALSDQQAVYEASREWWRQHKWAAGAVFGLSLLLVLVGATWLLFLFYLVSFGLLIYLLASFAKAGLGSRQVVGGTCLMGLMFLAQAVTGISIGSREIHFLDQKLVGAAFYIGVLLLLPFTTAAPQSAAWQDASQPKTPRWYWYFCAAFAFMQLLFVLWFCSLPSPWSRWRVLLVANLVFVAFAPALVMFLKARMARRLAGSSTQWAAKGLLALLLIALLVWLLSSLLWPVTPSRIKRYVESFGSAPHDNATWQNWEIVARWTIDAHLNPDLSKPRHFLNAHIAGQQNRFVLSSALRVGLLPAAEIGQLKLKEYEKMKGTLVASSGTKTDEISSLGQYDWVIRAAALRNDLSLDERNLLEQRLLATLENIPKDQHAELKTALEVTHLLAAIDRPIDRDRYRTLIHDLLRRFHVTRSRWSLPTGGFAPYVNLSHCDLNATAHAVELLEIYGIPDRLDLNWVRSYLRQLASTRITGQQWIAAASLNRLDSLPGVPKPTWLDLLYYERTLLAAIILVALCLYASLSSPHHGGDGYYKD